jgi:hypothetical protein
MDGFHAVSGRTVAVCCQNATADQHNNHHNSELTTFKGDDDTKRLESDGSSSPMPSTSEEIDEKKVGFASARGSAILATLTKDISELSGPRWYPKIEETTLVRSRRLLLLISPVTREGRDKRRPQV